MSSGSQEIGMQTIAETIRSNHSPELRRQLLGRNVGWSTVSRRRLSRVAIVCLLVYCALAGWMAVAVVAPALNGDGLRWWADSQYVMLYEEVYYNQPELQLAGSIYGPLLIARTLHYNALYICMLNCGMLVAIFLLLRRSGYISQILFVVLLLLNPMTFFSLTAINKEILGALGVALLVFYLDSRRLASLISAVIVSALARWPQALFVLAIAVAFYPRKWSWFKRYACFAAGLILLSVVYPYLTRQEVFDDYNDQVTHYAETQYEKLGGMLKTINDIEDNFGYPLVVVPKLALNWFGSLPRTWSVITGEADDGDDMYNTYVILFHQWSILAVLGMIAVGRRFRLNTPASFICIAYSVTFAIVPLLNSRTYFPMYPLLCLQAAGVGFHTLNRNPQIVRQPGT